MNRIIICITVIIIISTGVAGAHNTSGEVPALLEKLYGRLLTDSVDNNRIRINDSINVIISNYAASDTVFRHRFSNLRYLGQITSSDSLIKIITWNLLLKNGTGRYYCYLIKKNLKGNTLFRLTGTYDPDPISTDTIYHRSDWYGALYYDIRPSSYDDKKCWILLGINFGNPLITRKIIETVTFTPEDSIIFGKKWFDSGNKVKYREVFEYASTGIVSLRFASGNSIVFDHLVPISPLMINDHQFYGPDYSYDSYNLHNGLWKLSLNVDARNKK